MQVRFKQSILRVHLVNYLERKIHNLVFKTGGLELWRYSKLNDFFIKLYNFVERFRKHRCSIIIDGKYTFSPEEAKKYRPDLVEEYD